MRREGERCRLLWGGGLFPIQQPAPNTEGMAALVPQTELGSGTRECEIQPTPIRQTVLVGHEKTWERLVHELDYDIASPIAVSPQVAIQKSNAVFARVALGALQDDWIVPISDHQKRLILRKHFGTVVRVVR